jgi:hypothetical protein
MSQVHLLRMHWPFHLMQAAAEVARGSSQRAVLRAVEDSRMTETTQRCGHVARRAASNLQSDLSQAQLLPEMFSETDFWAIAGSEIAGTKPLDFGENSVADQLSRSRPLIFLAQPRRVGTVTQSSHPAHVVFFDHSSARHTSSWFACFA